MRLSLHPAPGESIGSSFRPANDDSLETGGMCRLDLCGPESRDLDEAVFLGRFAVIVTMVGQRPLQVFSEKCEVLC